MYKYNFKLFICFSITKMHLILQIIYMNIMIFNAMYLFGF